jgi:hypothetical protein
MVYLKGSWLFGGIDQSLRPSDFAPAFGQEVFDCVIHDETVNHSAQDDSMGTMSILRDPHLKMHPAVWELRYSPLEFQRVLCRALHAEDQLQAEYRL